MFFSRINACSPSNPVKTLSDKVPATGCVFIKSVKVCASKTPPSANDPAFDLTALNVFTHRPGIRLWQAIALRPFSGRLGGLPDAPETWRGAQSHRQSWDGRPPKYSATQQNVGVDLRRRGFPQRKPLTRKSSTGGWGVASSRRGLKESVPKPIPSRTAGP